MAAGCAGAPAVGLFLLAMALLLLDTPKVVLAGGIAARLEVA
ncbi:hypothetical protein [Massilia rubra]|nr:hypothetical protein [Massilia rubra]